MSVWIREVQVTKMKILNTRQGDTCFSKTATIKIILFGILSHPLVETEARWCSAPAYITHYPSSSGFTPIKYAWHVFFGNVKYFVQILMQQTGAVFVKSCPSG